MYHDHVTFGICDNSGSRSPFDTLTSALDMICQAASIERGLKGSTLPKNMMFERDPIHYKKTSLFGKVLAVKTCSNNKT